MMLRMPRRQPFNEQLIAAIKNCGISRYEIAKQTGVAESALSRFVNRKAGMSMPNINEVTKLLRLDLVKRESL